MFNRVIVPDFTPRQPHVIQQVGAQIPPPAPTAPPVVAAASPPALKPVYTTMVGQYSQPAQIIAPPPVTLNTQQGTPLTLPAVYTAPYTTVASTTTSGYSPNLETFASGNEPYFKLASAPSEARDWWQYPAAGPVDMSGNDLNMNSGSINAATTIGATDISATQQIGCSSLGADFVSTKALSSLQAFISSLDTNYISSQVGTISSLSTSIITLDGANLTTAGGTELLLNGIPVATTDNISSLSDWSLDPAISTINANSNNIIGVNDLQVSSINGGNLSSFSAANWWSFPALGTVDISNNAIVNVSTINGTVYPPPATGVTSVNAQTGVVALISAGSTITITNPSPGTINLETAAGSGFVTSVNGAPGAITITSDPSTISTSVVGGVTTFSAPTLGVSTDIATTCFGVANSASLSATSAGITANAAAVAAAAAQAAADAAAITAGTALASATTALAQSGVTSVNGGTFSTTIAAGTGIGVVTTYASGVQNPTITISATGLLSPDLTVSTLQAANYLSTPALTVSSINNTAYPPAQTSSVLGKFGSITSTLALTGTFANMATQTFTTTVNAAPLLSWGNLSIVDGGSGSVVEARLLINGTGGISSLTTVTNNHNQVISLLGGGTGPSPASTFNVALQARVTSGGASRLNAAVTTLAQFTTSA